MIVSVDENRGILNHYQIQEWKGGIQIIFLLYQYYYCTHNSNAYNNYMEGMYNITHFMNTCHLWLMGYDTFLYYHKTNHCTLSQILRTIWRLNFLVLFTCLTHGNPYILYYICPLHTYYFAVAYLVLYIGNRYNYTKKYWIRIKLGILSILIHLVWDIDSGLFDILHYLALFTSSSPSSHKN